MRVPVYMPMPVAFDANADLPPSGGMGGGMGGGRGGGQPPIGGMGGGQPSIGGMGGDQPPMYNNLPPGLPVI